MNRRISTIGARALQTQCIQVIHVENHVEEQPEDVPYEAEFSQCPFATGGHIQKGHYRFVTIKVENPYKIYFEWFNDTATGADVYAFLDSSLEEREVWKWQKEMRKRQQQKEPTEAPRSDGLPTIPPEKLAEIRANVTAYVLETCDATPIKLTLDKRLDDKPWNGTCTRIQFHARRLAPNEDRN